MFAVLYAPSDGGLLLFGVRHRDSRYLVNIYTNVFLGLSIILGTLYIWAHRYTWPWCRTGGQSKTFARQTGVPHEWPLANFTSVSRRGKQCEHEAIIVIDSSEVSWLHVGPCTCKRRKEHAGFHSTW